MWIIKRIAFTILNIYASIKTIVFDDPDFYLYRSFMIYRYNGHEIPHILDDYWIRESMMWEEDGFDDWNVVELTGALREIPDPPECIPDCFYKYKFNWSGKTYKMLTTDQQDWPPKWVNDRPMGLVRLPVKFVCLMDDDDKPLYNVTDKWKRYAGPYNDFFKCQNVKLEDIFLEDEYSKICIVNILNSKVIYNRDTYVSATLDAK